jgi:hypothetical protein
VAARAVVRRANRWEVATSCPPLELVGSMLESAAVAGAPASYQKAEDGADAKGDGNDWIGMFAHGFIGGLSAFDRLFADAAIDLLATFQCGGEALAGFTDFCSGHVGGGGDQSARVFGQRAHVVARSLMLVFHKVLALFVLCILEGRVWHGGIELFRRVEHPQALGPL